jgi:hypothetical protein
LAIGLFLLNINIYLVQLQIMGVDMTDETGLKVFQKPRIMRRRIMAFRAFRYGLMHPAVTCNTGQTAMFSVTRGQKPIFFFMTGPAILRGNFVTIGYMQRHMSLMAAKTVSHGHIGQMTGVTGKAGGFIPVPGVAGSAIKGRMHTGIFF